MPQVIIPAAVIAGLGTALATAEAIAAAGGLLAFFGTQFAIVAAFSGLSILLAGSRDAGFTVEARGRLATLRSPIQERRIVVGEALVSGPLVAYFFKDSTTQKHFNENATIPASSGTPTITVVNAATFLYSQGVFFVVGVGNSYTYAPLTEVASAPAAGQFSVGSGVYTFNAADKSKAILIQYRATTVKVEKEWHWFVIALSHGEVAEIGEVFLNGEPVGALDASGMASAGRFANHVRIKKYLGTQSQTADADLIAASGGGWSVTDRGQGVAYMIVALKRNPDIFTSGVPNMQAYVRGALYEDTRDGVTRWTNNPALVLRGYLRAEYGIAAAADEVLDSLVTAAANICDERVAMSAHTVQFSADPATDIIAFASPEENIDLGDKVQLSNAGGGLPGGFAPATDYYAIRLRDGSNGCKLATSYANALAGTAIDITSAGTGTHTMAHVDQARYACDGTINLGGKPIDIIGQLLASMAGAMVYSMGSMRIFAGAYSSPVHSFGVGDLRGDLTVRARTPRKELFNAVRGTYVSPFKDWQPGDFPPVKNATYAAQDGAEIARDIELPYTINTVRAQRIAKIHLEKSRQQIVCSGPYKLGALKTAVWDTIQVTDAELGWAGKVFRVTGWELAENGRGVELTYQEDSAASYQWNAGNETTVDPAPDTNLPNPFFVGVPGAPVMTEELYDTVRAVKVRANLTCEPAPDAFVSGYQFEYKLSSAAQWKRLPVSSAPSSAIEDAKPGLHDFRVSAINLLNVRSLYSSVFEVEIVGLNAAPAIPVIAGLQTVGGLAILSLDPHPDLDVRRGGRWRVRHSNATSGALWEKSFSIGEEQGYIADQTVLALPLKAGSYLVKAEDSTGHQSVNSASIATKRAQAVTFTALSSIQEDPVFSGTHSNTMVDGSLLKLVGVGMFDDIADFDAIASLDDYGGVSPSGTYTFSAGFDFGLVKNVRITGDIDGITVNVNDLIDDRAANIDTWLDFDGAAGGSADAVLQCRETDDNPSGAPTWSVWKRVDASEFSCRGMQFRLQMKSHDQAYNLHMDRLRVAADVV